jgi:hypothetical protein
MIFDTMDWYTSHKAWARYYDLNNPSDFVKRCNESRQLQEKMSQIKTPTHQTPTHQTVQYSSGETFPPSTPP